MTPRWLPQRPKVPPGERALLVLLTTWVPMHDPSPACLPAHLDALPLDKPVARQAAAANGRVAGAGCTQLVGAAALTQWQVGKRSEGGQRDTQTIAHTCSLHMSCLPCSGCAMKRAPQAFGAHTACVDGAHLRGVTRASGSKGSGFKLGGRCEHAASTLFNKSGQLPIPPSPPLSHRAVPVCVAAAFFAAGQPLQLIAWVERVRLTPRALQWGGVANQFGRQCAVWARGDLVCCNFTPTVADPDPRHPWLPRHIVRCG